ncbi:unnamed protein product [Ambrosiozyma monospora]|uniref:Unnamed protein product n=1 Tax=Ambrosiozyma monospora TaxID=43982 RepID=A0ACB5T4F5_AMBMO|nr:unnamed protein product [Ambrosiozyma monospora]
MVPRNVKFKQLQICSSRCNGHKTCEFGKLCCSSVHIVTPFACFCRGLEIPMEPSIVDSIIVNTTIKFTMLEPFNNLKTIYLYHGTSFTHTDCKVSYWASLIAKSVTWIRERMQKHNQSIKLMISLCLIDLEEDRLKYDLFWTKDDFEIKVPQDYMNSPDLIFDDCSAHFDKSGDYTISLQFSLTPKPNI